MSKHASAVDRDARTCRDKPAIENAPVSRAAAETPAMPQAKTVLQSLHSLLSHH
jgi:hypothetical protein